MQATLTTIKRLYAILYYNCIAVKYDQRKLNSKHQRLARSPKPGPAPAPGGLETQPQAREVSRKSNGWGRRVGWMIRFHWGSWEGLLAQLRKVELLTWTQPTPAPASRGLKTQPQASEVSRGVRVVW